MFKPIIIGRFRVRKQLGFSGNVSQDFGFRVDENCSSYNKKLRGQGMYFTHSELFGTIKSALIHISQIIAKDLEGTVDYRTIEKMLLKNYNFSI